MKKKIIICCSLFVWAVTLKAQQTEKLLKTVTSNFDKEAAFQTTAYVEKFWRVEGNAGFDSSIYYVAQLLEKAGYVKEDQAVKADRLTYRIEKYPMRNPAWEPVSARLNIDGETADLLNFETNRNMLAINSHGTHGKTIEAEVVHYSAADIKGKVIYGEMHVRSLHRIAVAGGAIGVLAYQMPHYTKPQIHQTSIQFGSIPYSKKPIWGICLSYDANMRIKKALLTGKFRMAITIETKFYKSEELTLVAEVKGSKKAEQRFVYSAHVQEPGANDNASGVAALAEMACVTAKLLTSKQVDPARSLTFIWGNEIESTHRYISQDKERAKTIMWGLSLDMVGENTAKTGGSFLIEKMPDPSAIWTRGADKHTEWGAGSVSQSDFMAHYFTDLATHICKTRGQEANWRVETNPFEGGSDHTPFLNANIPGLLFWHFTDVFYHTDNDRIDKVSKETLKNVGSSALVLGLFLTNGQEGAGKESLERVETAALKRLNAEYKLSKGVLEMGGDLNKERKIIKSWMNWYLKALETTAEIPVDGAAAEFQRAIKQSVGKVTEVGERLLKQLR
ncbi:MAG: M28 family peptidase [Flammeovirgaceae bacterium]